MRGREGAKSHLELYAFPFLCPCRPFRLIQFSALLFDRKPCKPAALPLPHSQSSPRQIPHFLFPTPACSAALGLKSPRARVRTHTRHFGTFHLLYLLSYSCLRVRPSQVSSYTTKAVFCYKCEADLVEFKHKSNLSVRNNFYVQSCHIWHRGDDELSVLKNLDRPHRKQDNPSKQSSSL